MQRVLWSQHNLHYDIEYPNVFVQGMTKATDIGITMSRKIKRVGCSTLKELMEENRLSVVDRPTITEMMTLLIRIIRLRQIEDIMTIWS